MRFNKFCNEIKFDIFSSLMMADDLCTKIAPVCREWRQFAYSSITWTTIKLDGKKHTDHQLTQILQRCSRVKWLIISNMNNFSWLTGITKRKSVREIGLCNCSVSADDFTQLVAKFPYVEQFYESSQSNISIAISPIIHWNYLRIISFTLITTDDAILDLITENCLQITQCCFATTHNLSDRSFCNFVTKRGPQLLGLVIGQLENISAESFKLLATKCRRLCDLEITEATNFEDTHLFNLHKLKDLKLLAISGAERLFSTEFPTLFTGILFPSLEDVTIDHENINGDYQYLKFFLQSCAHSLCELQIFRINLPSQVLDEIKSTYNNFNVYYQSVNDEEPAFVLAKRRSNENIDE